MNTIVIGLSGIDGIPTPVGINLSIMSGGLTSGFIASGQISRFHLASGIIVSGVMSSGAFQVAAGPGISVAATAPNVYTVTNTSGAGFSLSSGVITSGYIGNDAVTSGNIASGQIDWPHLKSGVIYGLSVTPPSAGGVSVATTITDSGVRISAFLIGGSVQGAPAGGTVYIRSGTIGRSDFASGAVLSGHLASGAFVVAAGDGISVAVTSPNVYTITNTSGAGGASLLSGTITSGFLATLSGLIAVNSGTLNSGAVAVLAGAGISVTPTGNNIFSIANTSGSFALTSGIIVSGLIGNTAVTSGNIASGQIAGEHIGTAWAGIMARSRRRGIIVASGFALDIVLSGAVTAAGLQWQTSYTTVNLADLTSAPGANEGFVSGTTAVTMIAAPGSGFVVDVAHISVANVDTASSLASVRQNGGGANIFVENRTQLAATYGLYWDGGWYVVDNNGNKGSTLGGSTAGGDLTGFYPNPTIASGVVGNFDIVSGGLGSGSIGSGQISTLHVASGGLGSGAIGSGQVSQNHLSSGIMALISGDYFDNKLINGGMAICQRYTPTALSSVTSGGTTADAYSADRWKASCSSGATVLYQRWDRLASGFASGVTARYYGRWVIGGSGKFALYQPIETINSQPLANQTLSFQFTGRLGAASSGVLLQAGFLQTNSGVAADTIPTSIVSGWALTSSGTNPTWGSGVSLLGTSTTVALTSGIWSTTAITTQSLSGHVCLIPAIWANHRLASGATIDMTEMGVYVD